MMHRIECTLDGKISCCGINEYSWWRSSSVSIDLWLLLILRTSRDGYDLAFCGSQTLNLDNPPWESASAWPSICCPPVLGWRSHWSFGAGLPLLRTPAIIQVSWPSKKSSAWQEASQNDIGKKRKGCWKQITMDANEAKPTTGTMARWSFLYIDLELGAEIHLMHPGSKSHMLGMIKMILIKWVHVHLIDLRRSSGLSGTECAHWVVLLPMQQTQPTRMLCVKADFFCPAHELAASQWVREVIYNQECRHYAIHLGLKAVFSTTCRSSTCHFWYGGSSSKPPTSVLVATQDLL